MEVAFYMNQHVPRAITAELRSRGVDGITAYEDGVSELDDPDLLDRAARLRRVLFTQDRDLLAEATKRQRQGIPFRGIVYAHQLHVSIGTCIRELEVIGKIAEPDEFLNRLEYLPL